MFSHVIISQPEGYLHSSAMNFAAFLLNTKDRLQWFISFHTKRFIVLLVLRQRSRDLPICFEFIFKIFAFLCFISLIERFFNLSRWILNG